MQTTTLKISGMTCMGCVNSVKKLLEKINGVNCAEVSLEPAQAIIQYDAAQTNLEQFKQTIKDAGFDIIDE